MMSEEVFRYRPELLARLPAKTRGIREGIPTPLNDRIVQIIHEIQEGKRKPSRENLKELEICLNS